MRYQDPKPQPKSPATGRVETSSSLASVPGDGAKSTNRTALLAEGRALAESIMEQQRRFWLRPFNQEERARLLGLQRKFATWEAEAARFGIVAAMEFPDAIHLLREYKPEVKTSDLARMRRTPSMLDAHFVSLSASKRSQERTEEVDTGMWGAAGPGI